MNVMMTIASDRDNLLWRSWAYRVATSQQSVGSATGNQEHAGRGDAVADLCLRRYHLVLYNLLRFVCGPVILLRSGH